jgi:hypothetical protein
VQSKAIPILGSVYQSCAQALDANALVAGGHDVEELTERAVRPSVQFEIVGRAL